MTHTPIADTVAILAGGKSLRMKTDKALLSWESGQTWIEQLIHVAHSLSPHVLLVTGEQVRYADLLAKHPIRIVPDHIHIHGPVGGIDTALRERNGRTVLILSCDMPQISIDSLRLLLREDVGTDLIYSNPTYFPLWVQNPDSLLSVLSKQMSNSHFSVQTLIESVRSKAFELPSVSDRFNFNTPEDVKNFKDLEKNSKMSA